MKELTFVLTLTDSSKLDDAYLLSIREKSLLPFLNTKEGDTIQYRVAANSETAFRSAVSEVFTRHGLDVQLYYWKDWYEDVVKPNWNRHPAWAE